jgi:GNAT superfamily N-acetyltransferase
MDVQLDLERRLPVVLSSEPSQLIVRPGLRTDLPVLRPVIDALAPWSRFAMDPRFGVSAAKRMYDAWLEKSAETDRRLFAVAIRNTKPVGFITVENGSQPKIGLIGTSESGFGIGRLLVHHAAEWALRHAQTLSVTTQARNVVALRFYGRNGFEVKNARYVYHLWLTPNEPVS